MRAVARSARTLQSLGATSARARAPLMGVRALTVRADPVADMFDPSTGDLIASHKAQVLENDKKDLETRLQSNPDAQVDDPPLTTFAPGYKYATLLYRAAYSEEPEENAIFRVYYDFDVRVAARARLRRPGTRSALQAWSRPRSPRRHAAADAAPRPPQRLLKAMDKDTSFGDVMENKVGVSNQEMVDYVDTNDTIASLNISEQSHTLLGASSRQFARRRRAPPCARASPPPPPPPQRCWPTRARCVSCAASSRSTATSSTTSSAS